MSEVVPGNRAANQALVEHIATLAQTKSATRGEFRCLAVFITPNAAQPQWPHEA